MADPFTIGVIAVGTLLQAGAQYKQGEQAYADGLKQKALNEVGATQAFAIGQRRGQAQKDQARMMAKRATAVAASGGNVADIENVIADIEAQGSYNAAVAMYEAETQAEGMLYEGKEAARIGKRRYTAGNIAAGATILQGAGQIASTIGPGGGRKDLGDTTVGGKRVGMESNYGWNG